MAQDKPTEKPMTLDDLAQMVQRGFADTASKKDLHDFREHVDDRFQQVEKRLDGSDLHLSAYASRWTEDFSKLHDWVEEDENRLRFLEKASHSK